MITNLQYLVIFAKVTSKIKINLKINSSKNDYLNCQTLEYMHYHLQCKSNLTQFKYNSQFNKNKSHRKMSDDSQEYTIQSQPKRSYKKLTERTKQRLREKVFSENMTIARAARNLKVKQSASKVYVRKIREQMTAENQKPQQIKIEKPQVNENIVKFDQNTYFPFWGYYPIPFFSYNQNQNMLNSE